MEFHNSPFLDEAAWIWRWAGYNGGKSEFKLVVVTSFWKILNFGVRRSFPLSEPPGRKLEKKKIYVCGGNTTRIDFFCLCLVFLFTTIGLHRQPALSSHHAKVWTKVLEEKETGWGMEWLRGIRGGNTHSSRNNRRWLQTLSSFFCSFCPNVSSP